MDSPPVPESGDEPEESPATWMDHARGVFLVIASLSMLIALAFLLYQLLTEDTSLELTHVVPADTESTAIIRANERVVQLVQWTISTILIVAGGLLGLNWYQNQKRYEDDKRDLLQFQRRMSREYVDIRRELAQDQSKFQERIEGVSNKRIEDLEHTLSSIDERVRNAEQTQERLEEQHRTHLLVQAVDEVTRTDNVGDAFAAIVSWYGQIREADNADQERALSLLWRGFEYIVDLIDEGAPPIFYDGDEPGANDRLEHFLAQVTEAYPEVQEYVDLIVDASNAWSAEQEIPE